ncbi:MAG: hypothetical protein AB7Y74_11690 [Syntrophorhabdus sp.]
MPLSLDAPPEPLKGFTLGRFRLVLVDFLRRHDHESLSLPVRLHVRPFGWVRHPTMASADFCRSFRFPSGTPCLKETDQQTSLGKI